MCCEKYFYDKFCEVIRKWNQDDIKAISILVYTNESFVYQGIENFYEISIGYISKNGLIGNDIIEELIGVENEEFIVEPGNYGESAEIILEWLECKGVKDIGFEDFDNSYDEDMNYIGKGPNGYYEVLMMIAQIAGELQNEGVISKENGEIPVIVHDLEYPWYVIDAVKLANPNGEAKEYLKFF